MSLITPDFSESVRLQKISKSAKNNNKLWKILLKNILHNRLQIMTYFCQIQSDYERFKNPTLSVDDRDRFSKVQNLNNCA